MKILDVPQSGSVAGVTSSRNRFGQYKRTRAVPVNPNTDRQSEVRARLASLSTSWGDLTDLQRTGWNSLAAAMGVTDSLGSVVYPTGFNRYVGTNLARLNNALAVLSEPPAPTIAAPAPTYDFTAEVTAPTIAITAWTVGERAAVYAAPYGRPGREYFSDFRYLQTVVAASTSSTVNIFDSLSAKFGAPVVDRMLAVRVDRYDTNGLLISQTVLRAHIFEEEALRAAGRAKKAGKEA